MAEPAAGVTLAGGRYELIERLGGGGMADRVDGAGHAPGTPRSRSR